MARVLNKLNRQRVKAGLKKAKETNKPIRLSDGGNLYNRCTPAETASWVFLYEFEGKQTEVGLGSYPTIGFTESRAKAAEGRRLLAQGIDPKTYWEAQKAATKAPTVPTGEQRLKEWIKSKEGSCTREHALQVENSLRKYAAPILAKPTNQVETSDVLAVLQPIWFAHPSASRRVRDRIEGFLDFCKLQGDPIGENPARWKGHLEHALPRRTKEPEHFRAMPYEQVPGLCRYLRDLGTTVAYSVLFQIWTGVRPTQAEARWCEFDGNIWTVPANRTKNRKPFRVPLSSHCLEILETLYTQGSTGEFVFPSPARAGRPISLSFRRKLLPANASLHGFRSSLRDFAAEQTHFPREICEEALGHTVGNVAERSYRRSDLLERRRQLMQAWADFCCGASAGNIVAIGGRK